MGGASGAVLTEPTKKPKIVESPEPAEETTGKKPWEPTPGMEKILIERALTGTVNIYSAWEKFPGLNKDQIAILLTRMVNKRILVRTGSRGYLRNYKLNTADNILGHYDLNTGIEPNDGNRSRLLDLAYERHLTGPRCMEKLNVGYITAIATLRKMVLDGNLEVIEEDGGKELYVIPELDGSRSDEIFHTVLDMGENKGTTPHKVSKKLGIGKERAERLLGSYAETGDMIKEDGAFITTDFLEILEDLPPIDVELHRSPEIQVPEQEPVAEQPTPARKPKEPKIPKKLPGLSPGLTQRFYFIMPIADDGGITPDEYAKRLGFAKAEAGEELSILEERGFLEKTEVDGKPHYILKKRPGSEVLIFDEIMPHLESGGEISARDCAEISGLSVSDARTYLQTFEVEEFLTSRKIGGEIYFRFAGIPEPEIGVSPKFAERLKKLRPYLEDGKEITTRECADFLDINVPVAQGSLSRLQEYNLLESRTYGGRTYFRLAGTPEPESLRSSPTLSDGFEKLEPHLESGKEVTVKDCSNILGVPTETAGRYLHTFEAHGLLVSKKAGKGGKLHYRLPGTPEPVTEPVTKSDEAPEPATDPEIQALKQELVEHKVPYSRRADAPGPEIDLSGIPELDGLTPTVKSGAEALIPYLQRGGRITVKGYAEAFKTTDNRARYVLDILWEEGILRTGTDDGKTFHYMLADEFAHLTKHL